MNEKDLVNRKQNPITEYLLKLQIIVTNTEFKDKAEAMKYETLESKQNGEKYCRAMMKTDIFESYDYNPRYIYSVLEKDGCPDAQIRKYLIDLTYLPNYYKIKLKEAARDAFIHQYEEPNNYYRMLNGLPNIDERPITIPDAFYRLYETDYAIYRDQPIHLLPDKYLELFMNSDFYQKTKTEHPEARYLNYIGSNKIDIVTARMAKDGDILRINTNKLSKYHELFGHVTVSPDIVHAYVSIYHETRDYVYYTLRGNFSEIYTNYDSFIRFLTIYLSIGNALNEFMKKSTKMIYMNNSTANNLFMLYGLPSVIMTGTSMIDFLKKFRLLLMDKGTNIVYHVKDLIGYQYTDIYTLIMVKQQVYENGIPIYHYLQDGTRIPKQEIVFRRFGTTDDNTSYFKFKNESKSYSLEEITSGDPRWWNTPEVEQILQEANYTLSNSKYIQLSTTVSMTDIWWECVILLRGLLDENKETRYTELDVNFNVNGSSTMYLFDAVLTLILLMNLNLKDAYGNPLSGAMYFPNGSINGINFCLDLLFNGLYMAKPYKIGVTYHEGDIVGLKDLTNSNGAYYLYPDAFLMQNIYVTAREFVATNFEEDITNGNLIKKDYWDEASPKESILGLPYKISSFKFDIKETEPEFYESIKEMDYIEPEKFIPMLEEILTKQSNNVGSTIMHELKFLYDYLEEKLYQCKTIHDFRQVTDLYQHLFLVEPTRNWSTNHKTNITTSLCEYFNIDQYDYQAFILFTKKETQEADYYVHFNGKDYPISIYQILTENVYDISILDDYPFRNTNFVNTFEATTMAYYSNQIESASIPTEIELETINVIESSTLSNTIKKRYQEMIVYKVKLELGNTKYGPSSFESLMMRENPELYQYLLELKKTPESLILFLRAIINGLEDYTNHTLSGLQFKALGLNHYFYILKEVISYFKSYMVEFSKEEFCYLFDGLFDQGGNSNMLKLCDEISHGTNELLPKDSATLYDVSCADVYGKFYDDNAFHIYDDALIRIKTTYATIKNLGYELWYDHHTSINKTPFYNLKDQDDLIAEFHYDKNQKKYHVILRKK